MAPGTPWKARPVRCCRPGTPGRRGVLGGTVGAEGELVRVPAQGLHIGLQLLGQGVLSG